MGSGKSTQAIRSSEVIVRPVLEEVAGEAEVWGTMARSAPLCCHDVWPSGRVRMLALQYNYPPYTLHLHPYMLALPHLRGASVKRPFRGGTYNVVRVPTSSPHRVYLHCSVPFLHPHRYVRTLAGCRCAHDPPQYILLRHFYPYATIGNVKILDLNTYIFSMQAIYMIQVQNILKFKDR